MTAAAQRSGLRVRHGCFVLLVIAALALFRNPVSALASLAVHDERYSYIAFIPFISAFLIYLDAAGFPRLRFVKGAGRRRCIAGDRRVLDIPGA
jgi:hypothetical protein